MVTLIEMTALAIRAMLHVIKIILFMLISFPNSTLAPFRYYKKSQRLCDSKLRKTPNVAGELRV